MGGQAGADPPGRPKLAKLADGPARDLVVEWLRQRWSPQQVAARLRIDFPDRPEMWVSHETIYQAIYLQGRGSLRELIDDHLRVTRKARRSQSRAAQAARGAIRGKPWVTEQVHIRARPAEVTDRAVPGHWEGDLVAGAHNRTAIVTLAERSTRFVLLGHLPVDRTAREVVAIIRRLFARLPAALRRSLTWDQGGELPLVGEAVAPAVGVHVRYPVDAAERLRRILMPFAPATDRRVRRATGTAAPLPCGSRDREYGD